MNRANSGDDHTTVDNRYFEVTLPPGRSIDLRCGMDRYVHRPSYDQPV
jgi:hypothetical protein